MMMTVLKKIKHELIEFRTIKKKYNEPGGLTKNFASECQNELSLRCL